LTNLIVLLGSGGYGIVGIIKIGHGSIFLKSMMPLTETFFSSTKMQNGNGKRTPFWEGRWLNRAAPKDLAPNLFRLAMFKKRSVHAELQNSNWIRNLQDIHTPSQIEEFTMLFMALESVSLTDQEDSIKWRWTVNDSYSVASAYECQFLGAMINFPATEIWRAKYEQKCKFFAWLVLHDKALTAENMIKKDGLATTFAHCVCAWRKPPLPVISMQLFRSRLEPSGSKY
jgi:hypothetical protein